MTITLGSGLGGFAAVAAQPTYGATMVTPSRVISSLKSFTPTHDPHIVQGGPYLQAGNIVNYGSAHVQTWLDATGTISGDFLTSGMALLFATAFGSPTLLTQIASTTAYQLGTTGITVGAPDKNNGGGSGCCFDMQVASPDVSTGTLHQFNYHSCMITKADLVFDRVGLVTFQYAFDAQTVEETTALITPTTTTAPTPFSMANASSLFKIGALGSETALDGCRKATFSIERKLSTDRIYLGNQLKDMPVTSDVVGLTASLEFDYTTQARAVMETFLTNTPQSIIATAVGPLIASGTYNTVGLQLSNGFIQTGGEAPLAGADIVKNTVTFAGTINAAATSPLTGTLITADTTF